MARLMVCHCLFIPLFATRGGGQHGRRNYGFKQPIGTTYTPSSRW